MKPMKRTLLLLSLSLSFLLASTAFGIQSKPSAVTYIDGAGHQLIYSFASGNNGHLVVNYGIGPNGPWNWADLGLPAGVSAVYAPTAIMYQSGSQQLIYVFATASNGHLVVNYGFAPPGARYWEDQGLPAGSSGVYSPAAVAYGSGAQQLISVFATGSNHHLVVNYWDGSWHWADMGLPPGVSAVNNPVAIIFPSGGQQLVYVFAEGSNGHLVLNYGFAPPGPRYWEDHGLPTGAIDVSAPTAITYASGGQQRINVFAVADNADGKEHLVVNYWDGSWHWADEGLPAGASLLEDPVAITYVSGGQQLVYVFATAGTGLFVNYGIAPPGTRYWADQGLPAGASAVYTPSGITYLNSLGDRLIYVFGRADNWTSHDLVVDYWAGYWSWADRGDR